MLVSFWFRSGLAFRVVFVVNAYSFSLVIHICRSHFFAHSASKVADWWEKYVYLAGRSPIVINSNFYVLDCKMAVPPTTRMAARAANMSHLCLQIKQRLDNETFEPMTIRGTVPLCMWQYERVFATDRIPGRVRAMCPYHMPKPDFANLIGGGPASPL